MIRLPNATTWLNPDSRGLVSTQGEEETVETGDSSIQPMTQTTTSLRTQTTSSQSLLQGRTPVTKKTKSIAIAPLSKSTVTNIAGSYVSLLANNPLAPSQSLSNEAETVDQPDVDLNDQLAVWNYAMSLANAGSLRYAALFWAFLLAQRGRLCSILGIFSGSYWCSKFSGSGANAEIILPQKRKMQLGPGKKICQRSLQSTLSKESIKQSQNGGIHDQWHNLAYMSHKKVA